MPPTFSHPQFSRRTALQAGAVGLLNLGMGELQLLRASERRGSSPPAVVLPDRIVHNSGRVIPGQFAGVMGRARDPWFLEASLFEPKAYGAYPEFEFDHQQRPYEPKRKAFVIPDLSLPQGVDPTRF